MAAAKILLTTVLRHLFGVVLNPEFPITADSLLSQCTNHQQESYLFGVLIMLICASCQLKYASAVYRRASYTNIPWESHWKSPEKLTEAGFYATGNDDEVKCYHCNVGLRSWEENDEPWTVHQDHSGKCFHVRLHQIAKKSIPMPVEEVERDGRKFYSIGRRLMDIVSNDDAFKIVVSLAYETQYVLRVLSRIYLRSAQLKTDSGELMKACQSAEESGEVPKDGDLPIVELVEKLASYAPVRNETSSPVRAPQQSNERVQVSSATPDGATQPAVKPKPAAAGSMKSDPTSKNGFRANDRCIKCHKGVLQYVLLPCGHLAICEDCKVSTRRCPECNSAVRGSVRTFIS